jgi:hypothetical protein
MKHADILSALARLEHSAESPRNMTCLRDDDRQNATMLAAIAEAVCERYNAVARACEWIKSAARTTRDRDAGRIVLARVAEIELAMEGK